MAELLLPDLPQQAKKPRTTVVEKIEKLRKASSSLADNLVLLTISFWYFFWTGIAVARGKTIPKQWLDIATNLSKKKLAEKIEPTVPVAPLPVRHRVVDLETSQQVVMPSSSN